MQFIGAAILGSTFINLIIHTFIFNYYDRTDLILNWYLYTYLICAFSMFAGSYCWRKTESESPKTLLNALGGILLFTLINVEIANYFSNGAGELYFHFCGKLAEAAAYTIAWAICGAICMFLTVKKPSKLLYVGIGLISLSVLKLFLSDIWELSSGLRIAVLIIVAVIMLLISFIYQQLKKITSDEAN